MTNLWAGVDLHPTLASGCCNQLYNVARAVRMFVCDRKIPFLFLNSFLVQLHQTKTAPIRDVFNLELSNYAFRDAGVDVWLVDAANYTFCVDSVVQSGRNVLQRCHVASNGDVRIPAQEFSSTGGACEVYFRLDGKHKSHVVEKPWVDGVTLAPSTVVFETVRSVQDKLYWTLLTLFRFRKEIVREPLEWAAANLPSAVQVFHLRIEDDFVRHTSAETGETAEVFKRRIEDTYIGAIRQHVNPRQPLVIITGQYDNRVMEFLKENNYNIVIPPKFHADRELAALCDLHIATSSHMVVTLCMVVYESSFSFTLMHRCNHDKSLIVEVATIPARQVLIDTKSGVSRQLS